MHGVGKATVVKVAKKGCFPLFCIGYVHAEIKSVEAHATKFMCTAYGKVAESCNSMTECRVKVWRSKTGKSGASSVKLCSIQPTTEAFTENLHRCHLQVAKWKAALLESPELESTMYGWELDHIGIRCNGKASGCRTAACSCTKIGYTIFCLFEGAEACKNSLTRSQTENESEKTIEDPDDNDM